MGNVSVVVLVRIVLLGLVVDCVMLEMQFVSEMVSGCRFVFLVMRNGQRNLFYGLMKVISMIVISMGWMSGSVIEVSRWILFVLLMCVVLKIFIGSVLKNCMKMNIVVVLMRNGRIIFRQELFRLQFWVICMYSGIISSWNGIICMSSISIQIILCFWKLRWVIVQLVSSLNIMVFSSILVVKIREFSSELIRLMWELIVMKLLIVQLFVGNSVFGELVGFFWNVLMIMKQNGKVNLMVVIVSRMMFRMWGSECWCFIIVFLLCGLL